MKHVTLNNIGDFTEIACVLDRSGSMYSIVNDAIGGFNTFLKEQRELEGNANISIYFFNDRYESLVENIDVKSVKDLTIDTYRTGGSTALFDSIGKTVINLEQKINDMEVKPKNTLVVILTDGEENSSKEFTDKTKIKEMIEKKRGEGNWEFLFLAANQDAFAEATSYGMSVGNSMNFTATGDGVKHAYMKMSKSASKFRGITLSDYEDGSAVSYAANLMDDNE